MLILASQSPTRQRLLHNARVPFRAISASIDERLTETTAPSQEPSIIALHLAKSKAHAVSQNYPNTYVIGADQLLTCEGQRYHKPTSRKAAREQLEALRGKSHELQTAVCIVLNNECVMTDINVPRLAMRWFSDTFLDHYMDNQTQDVLHSPGCYRYEEQGIQLFDHIEGDMHSILGLPLLPLLAFLRSKELLAS